MTSVYGCGVIPVAVVSDVKQALVMADALEKGGLPVIEITFRTSCAQEAIKQIKKEFPNVSAGAGTVLTKKQCLDALDAGANFIVSPGFSEEVACVCQQNDIIYLPGCVTPTEITNAYEKGIRTVKFFPAQLYGGLNAVKSLSSVFTDVSFVPTGGVNAGNLKEYLSFSKIKAVGGSWITKGCSEEIVMKAKEALLLAKEAGR